MYDDRRMAERMRRLYPPGTAVEVERMGPDPRPIPPGTRGIVETVDDLGTVHCVFENGRRLGLIPGEDAFRALREREDREER